MCMKLALQDLLRSSCIHPLIVIVITPLMYLQVCSHILLLLMMITAHALTMIEALIYASLAAGMLGPEGPSEMWFKLILYALASSTSNLSTPPMRIG